MLDAATRDRRNELMDAYLAALEAHEFERFRDLFAGDVTFAAFGETVQGIDAMIDWYESGFRTENNVHDYHKRLHGEDDSAAYGQLRGDLPDGSRMEARGLDVFGFDADATEMTKLVVYTDLPPNL